ncbi:hypothetical protein PVK06_009109 [Gossypium arboreum]|uniref:Uncharacterized protein n=1 Tax=Gossypium arboreum TaxID=29729 RepID=A0ABR0QLK9_GOSAR|nr:hypothetical protein PVK06_009109 [Gossypium arboreum]
MFIRTRYRFIGKSYLLSIEAMRRQIRQKRTTLYSSTEEGYGDEDGDEAEGRDEYEDEDEGGDEYEYKDRGKDEDDGDDHVDDSTTLVVRGNQ